MQDRLNRTCSASAVAALALSYAGPAGAEVDHDVFERQRTETDGPAISGGLGSQYIMLGGQAAYYFQLPRSLFRLRPWVALGQDLWVGDDEDTVAILGTAAGISGSWGHKHRMSLTLFYGPAGTTGVSLHGEEPDYRLEWGPGMTVGYEYMAFSGFFLHANAGVQVVLTSPILPLERQVVPALTLLGLGYKLW